MDVVLDLRHLDIETLREGETFRVECLDWGSNHKFLDFILEDIYLGLHVKVVVEGDLFLETTKFFLQRFHDLVSACDFISRR